MSQCPAKRKTRVVEMNNGDVAEQAALVGPVAQWTRLLLADQVYYARPCSVRPELTA